MSDLLHSALRDCAREPIHIPGAIQPHGALVTFAAEGGVVLQVSENLEAIVGAAPEAWLGRPIEACVGEAQAAILREALRPEEPTSPLALHFGGRTFDGLLHRAGEVVVLEIEPADDNDATRAVPLLHAVLSRTLRDLQQAGDLLALSQTAAKAVAEIAGFERVMVYRFDRDWHGEVIAEWRHPEVDSYLGLHFPASDIPEQARLLYLKNWLRLIANSTYTPARLVPELNPATGQPLDLSQSALRSVSPVHLEYLRNMGVGSSMSVSLVREGRLWGLIACHHRQPRHVSYARRGACQLIGQIMSAEIGTQEAASRQAARMETQAVQTRFLDHLAQSEQFVDALVRYTPELLALLQAHGAALVLDEKCILLGKAPEEEQVRRLLPMIRRADDYVFHSDCLGELDASFELIRTGCSGVLAVALSELRTDYVLWFRPEVLGTVHWAGNPTKAVEEGSLRLHPRKSFATWQQIVTGHSARWTEIEIGVALELRTAINATIFKRYDRLRRLGDELQRKVTDLDSFAYIASHDLKEPLRGITNYAQFVLEDTEGTIDAESARRLRAIHTMAGRSSEQLDALLNFSRVGRRAMELQPLQVEAVVREAMETLRLRIDQTAAEVTVQPGLPPVLADPTLLREILENLMGNALKYSDQPPRIEIGANGPGDFSGQTTFFVKDNGIGIPAHLQPEVFRIFRRLHPLEAYGGGTGAGLAVVKSVVERHGGEVWVESEPGRGSTFFFTLGQ